MDIDDLGKIFQSGIRKSYKGLLHTAALSRALDWFFQGYMNSMLDEKLIDHFNQEEYWYSPGEKEEKKHFLKAYFNRLNPKETFRDNLYVIFSGGDDFMLVGSMGYRV